MNMIYRTLPILRVHAGWHHFSWLLKMQVEKLLYSVVILILNTIHLTTQDREAEMDFILSISFPTPKLNHFLLSSKIVLFHFMRLSRAYIPYRRVSYVV